MVKLRGFCFKGADLDNAASITACLFPQNGDKHCRCATAQRFAKPFFSMRSTGFWIDFCFFTALLHGFIVHIFNYELIAMFKQFVGENVMLHFANVSQLTVQIAQFRTQAIIPFAVFPFAPLFLSMLPLQPFDCAIRIIIFRICSAARTVHCAKRSSNFVHKTLCLRSCSRSKHAKVTNILTAKGNSLSTDIYTDTTLFDRMFCNAVVVTLNGRIAFKDNLGIILPFGADPFANYTAVFNAAFERFLLIPSRLSVGISQCHWECIIPISDVQLAFANGSFDFCCSSSNLFFHLCFYFVGKNNFFAFFGVWFSVRSKVFFLNRVFSFCLGRIDNTCGVICWTKHYSGSIIFSGY